MVGKRTVWSALRCAFAFFIVSMCFLMSREAYAATKLTGNVKLLVASYDNGSVQQAVDLFRKAGATVSSTNKDAANIDTSKYDGLIIPGSSRDITPSFYGAKSTNARNCNKTFDRYRFKMIRKFVLAGKPVYGICGGGQSINVLFGGTLTQHINGHMGVTRKIRLSRKSIHYWCFGYGRYVSHWHHQCVKKVAPGFIATEWDIGHGNIEAIQHEKYPIYGIQYHPEFMGNDGLKMARRFMSFCLKYREKPIKVDKADLEFISY